MSPDASLAASVLAVMVGALIQATGGIGFAMFAAPIVAGLVIGLAPHVNARAVKSFVLAISAASALLLLVQQGLRA